MEEEPIMSSLDKRGISTITLLASVVKRSIDKTMNKELDTVENRSELNKAICSEIITTLNKKDDE